VIVDEQRSKGRLRAGSRREFLAATGGGLVAMIATRRAVAQRAPAQTMSGPMSAEAYVAVARPPRAGASPQLSIEQRDSLERHLKCQCGCPLDIYTCRTTDFACPVSPKVHADVEALIAGGYSEAEIRDAFVAAYGERVLTAPKPQGFNLLAYVAPFVALGVGAGLAAWLIRQWRRPVPVSPGEVHIPQVAGTAEEMARLDAAVRDDSR
jgi:cytochrome c-type biogenesis protein CcmH